MVPESQRPKTKGQRPKTREVAAVLLAAGRSERMGQFKPLLPFGNRTVIEACIDNLRTGGVETIVVVVGHRAEEIRQRLKENPVALALNADATSEMKASIACGVGRLPNETRAVLVALADQPAVPGEVIKAIVNEWALGEKLVIPQFRGRGGHPVLVDLCFREELLSLDPGGLKAFFDAHRDHVRRVSVSSPFIARDMDTWDDYRALHEEIFGVPPTDLGT